MGVKLFLFGWPVGGHFVRVGCTLLFAVGVRPPHDGVRKARRLNLFHDLVDLSADGFETLNEIILPFAPTGTICFTSQANLFISSAPSRFPHAAAIAGSLPKWNSVLSRHIRCRMTASLRATATRARAMPRRLASFMPQARKLDHLRLRISRQ